MGNKDMTAKDSAMIETLQELCSILSTDPLTAPEAAASLGDIEEDEGGSSPITVRPYNSSFRTAQVVRKYDTDEPAHVRLDLAEAGAGALSVANLKAAFGDYREVPRMRPKTPARIAFLVDEPDQPYNCTLIVDVVPGEGGVEQGTVKGFTLRRDIKLE